jgi:hypothetical protein
METCRNRRFTWTKNFGLSEEIDARDPLNSKQGRDLSED